MGIVLVCKDLHIIKSKSQCFAFILPHFSVVFDIVAYFLHFEALSFLALLDIMHLLKVFSWSSPFWCSFPLTKAMRIWQWQKL